MMMNDQEYGDDYRQHFLEQYKILADSLNGLRTVKEQTNRFHISTISIIVVLTSLLVGEDFIGKVPGLVLVLVPLIGLCLCYIWYFNIRSFGLTMESRYRVLHDMEKHLPYPCFNTAISYMGEKENRRSLTKVERFLPIVFGVAFLIMLIYVITQLLCN